MAKAKAIIIRARQYGRQVGADSEIRYHNLSEVPQAIKDYVRGEVAIARGAAPAGASPEVMQARSAALVSAMRQAGERATDALERGGRRVMVENPYGGYWTFDIRDS